MDTTIADTLIGTTIDGRYRITGRVARGGMATVYTATDERLERTVALKIIHPSQATNVHFVDRFTDEAKTIARLTHPNVVAVYDQARAVEASSTDDSGQLMATVAYVAPELVTDGHADARTDVYSAGIVLFEMLTGRVPFDGDDPVAVAWQHVDRDVPPPSRYVADLPVALDDLVGRATRRDPGARPTDAGALPRGRRPRGHPGGACPAVPPNRRPAGARLPDGGPPPRASRRQRHGGR